MLNALMLIPTKKPTAKYAALVHPKSPRIFFRQVVDDALVADLLVFLDALRFLAVFRFNLDNFGAPFA